MRIDSNLAQKIPSAAIPQQKEVPGEREPDGDADDRAKAISRNQPQTQILKDEAGKKINILV